MGLQQLAKQHEAQQERRDAALKMAVTAYLEDGYYYSCNTNRLIVNTPAELIGELLLDEDTLADLITVLFKTETVKALYKSDNIKLVMAFGSLRAAMREAVINELDEAEELVDGILEENKASVSC